MANAAQSIHKGNKKVESSLLWGMFLSPKSTKLPQSVTFVIDKTEIFNTPLDMHWMEVVALICAFVGIVGCVVPVLPGVPIVYIGILLCLWQGAAFSTANLVWWAVVAVGVTLLDNFLPAVMTKRFGGSKAGSRGALIGIFAGMFFGPLGIILGPFLGALVGELTHDGSNSARAFKVAFGSFAAFLLGTGIKLIAAIYLTRIIWQQVF